MKRVYICDTVYDPLGGVLKLGIYRPAIAVILLGRHFRVIEDARAVLPTAAVQSNGRMVVEADLSSADHLLAIADIRVTFVPLQRSDATPLLPDEPISLLSAADRSSLTSVLEAQHIPAHNFTNATTANEVMRQIVRRLRIRRRLGADDITEGLDTTVGQLTIARSNAVTAKLQADAFDLSAITTATPIRDALVNLQNQNNQYLISEFG